MERAGFDSAKLCMSCGKLRTIVSLAQAWEFGRVSEGSAR